MDNFSDIHEKDWLESVFFSTKKAQHSESGGTFEISIRWAKKTKEEPSFST
jgi:hypothetical protein